MDLFCLGGFKLFLACCNRASKFLKGYGDKGKGSEGWKFHGLAATWGPTVVFLREKFLILKSLDQYKMHSWACGLPPYINANMIDIKIWKYNLKYQFESTKLLSFAISQNQINFTD